MTIPNEIAYPLIIGAIGALIKMWVDIAMCKRDIDGIAEVVGTERARARRKK